MTFLIPATESTLKPEAKALRDARADAQGGSITGLQAALLANPTSFRVSLGWQALWDEIAPWIGERALTLFAYAIADEDGSLPTALSFRRTLLEAGDDPDNPQVTEAEQLLIDWGRLIVRSPHDIPDEFYSRLQSAFGPERRLTLLAFAGQTVALDLLATVGRIPLDPDLEPYRQA
ncbi:MAG TPA: hypothetical protein VGC18_05690 [Lacisediminihabitans sp.]|uniref:hypothetical protein n=1 Tax=Lacisediminihabitans sp. TaxID=2787631 RepID=UPI002EDBAB64